MECPKCGKTIDENLDVCPHCKKVLKLICPICGAKNESNTCQNCGYPILTKCNNCGKVNPTIKGKCSKCGFDTFTSSVMQNANIDDFACLYIDFPNMKDMKSIFGNKKLFEKFKSKIYQLLKSYAKNNSVKWQIIDDSFIVRFNKDYTYSSSAKNAFSFAVEVLNRIANLNRKLYKAKNALFFCNTVVMKKNVQDPMDSYKQKVNIQLISKAKGPNAIYIKGLQSIVDSSIKEVVGKDYKLESIGSAIVKESSNNNTPNSQFYEVDLNDLIVFDEIPEDKPMAPAIPITIEQAPEVLEQEENLYDDSGISFDEIHCNFIKEPAQGLSAKVSEILASGTQKVIVMKGKPQYFPRTQELIDKTEATGAYKHIHKVTCYDNMKFMPYKFFIDLISGIFSLSSIGYGIEANNFSAIDTVDQSGFIKDTVNLNEREFPHPEDVRFGIFEILETLVSKMKKTLIVIEDAEKMDDTSAELFYDLLKKFQNFDISWLILANKDYNLQRYSHHLLSRSEYTEITLQPTPIQALIDANAALLENLVDSFYMQNIAKNTKGSQTYFMQALLHMIDLGILAVEEGKFKIQKYETVLLPPSYDELLQKRMLFLKSTNKQAYNLYTVMHFLAPQIDLQTVQRFEAPNLVDTINHLNEKGFITINNETIFIQNYNIFHKNLLKIMTNDEIQAVSDYCTKRFFKNENTNIILAELYSILGDKKSEFIQWEKLSRINKSLGDFSAYLNCSLKYLDLLDDLIDESSEKSAEEIKMEVYDSISNLLYKYTPEKIANITKIILENLENSTDNDKIINLCNKIMQGCLISGNYNDALIMSNKILSKLGHADIDPKSPNFSVNAFMISLIKLEILFNVGNLEDLITLGEELFTIIANNNKSSLKPEAVSDSQYDSLILDSAGYIIFAKILQLKQDTPAFIELAEKVIPNMPKSYELFLYLDKILHKQPIDKTYDTNSLDSKFAKFLYNIVEAFKNLNENWEEFAAKVYQAKLGAKEFNLNQLELFCDLMIGRAYFYLDNNKKAFTIFNSIFQTAKANGLQNLLYLADLSLAELAIKNEDYNSACAIINNDIVKLEKSPNQNMYILRLFKVLLANILQSQHEDTQADFCYNQAQQISEIYKI